MTDTALLILVLGLVVFGLICVLLMAFSYMKMQRQISLDRLTLERQQRLDEHVQKLELEEAKTQRASIYANRDIVAAQLEAQALGSPEPASEEGGLSDILMSVLQTPQGQQMVGNLLGGLAAKGGNFPSSGSGGAAAAGGTPAGEAVLQGSAVPSKN
ncbi:MAG: hypothetical protein O0X93_06410 [Methanocorpusculum sp.]|nr:hypothetical protein [Methanocorpusculum sp.]MDE2524283.1 hypothetical protein [Methanocorpusculum sp.]